MTTLLESQETKQKFEAVEQLERQLTEKKKEAKYSKAIDNKFNNVFKRIKKAFEDIQGLLEDFPGREGLVKEFIRDQFGQQNTSLPHKVTVSKPSEKEMDNFEEQENQEFYTSELANCSNRNEIEGFRLKHKNHVYNKTLNSILSNPALRDKHIKASAIIIPGTPLLHITGRKKEIVFYFNRLEENMISVYTKEGKLKQVKGLNEGTVEWCYDNKYECSSIIKDKLGIMEENSDW